MQAVVVRSTTPFRLSVLTASLSLLAMFCPPAKAQDDKNWYSGVAIGKSLVNIDTTGVLAKIQATGAASAQVSSYDDDSVVKVFAGYHFRPNLAVELGYGDFGEFEFDALAVPAATQVGKAKIKGVSLSLLGTMEVAAQTTAFAKIGINHASINQSFTNSALGPGFANGSDSGTHLNYGAGINYAFSDVLSARLEVERWQMADNRVTNSDLTAFTLGVVYRFGSHRAAVAEAPVQQAPAPVASAPLVAAPVAAEPPPLVKVTLQASALFDFDKSELKASGKEELDKLAQDIRAVRYDVMIVTGHTDRIGKRSYNQALSLRRANAVKAYLVSAGIAADNITAKGVGSDQPVTWKDQCTGPVNDALKSCLQPDRRVEVQVNGTRNP